MTPLLTALLGTLALLLLLWVGIQAGWWLALRLIEPLLEHSRTTLQQERIQRHHQALEGQRQVRARERAQPRQRVVDLDGQPRWLAAVELAHFHRLCWAELGLAEGSAWPLVRRHWRLSSLRWHPDHGGDPALWLRKQRAYGALKAARSPGPGKESHPPPPRPLQGRRRFSLRRRFPSWRRFRS